MEKSQKFLWVVQTTVLTNSIALASNPALAKQFGHVTSADGVRFLMCEAVRASELIPKDMDVVDAADSFCVFALDNLKENYEKASGQELKLPSWFALG
jgi:hypothetical protein